MPGTTGIERDRSTRVVAEIDFEGADALEGWWTAHPPYRVEVESADAEPGEQALCLASGEGDAPEGGPNFGVASRELPIETVRGKWLRYTGYIRTEDVVGGHAGLWTRVDLEKEGEEHRQTLAFDNMQTRGPTGTTPWTEYYIELPVSEEATKVVFGALLTGTGTAWFDSFAVEAQDMPKPRTPLPLSAKEEKAAVQWLRENAIPFEIAEPVGDHDDLMPLKHIVGDARIVALGEATHGTREFFQMKHRITRFLAMEMGFTIFAIEANMPETYRMNDYVLGGDGDPRRLLDGMYFWTWNTEEVLEMILWMREFNASGAGRMEFVGFDMQTPTVAMDIVRDFVAMADPDDLGLLDREYALGRALAAACRGPDKSKQTDLMAQSASSALGVLQHLLWMAVQECGGYWGGVRV